MPKCRGYLLGRRCRLDSVKRRFRAVQERLNRDLLSVEAREGLKQAMGLGEGGMAISLFAMPTMMDYAHEVRYTQIGGRSCTCNGAVVAAYYNWRRLAFACACSTAVWRQVGCIPYLRAVNEATLRAGEPSRALLWRPVEFCQDRKLK